MYKQYLFPMSMFLILEKASVLFWGSKTLVPNHYIVLLNSKWFYILNQIFKNELFFSSSLLIENTAIDSRFFNKCSTELNTFFKKNKLIAHYSYYFLLTKIRLTILVNLKNDYKHYINSIDKIYKNANWLERETSEMYGLLYYWKSDTRKLLLDYAKMENPMLKDFPCEGIQDVFYNFFENQVVVQKNEVVEL